MLEKALRQGVISPDTVSQLSLAARSINEDVANQISRASYRINEDVASLLISAADRLSIASSKLDLDEFDRLVRRLEGVLDQQGGSNLNSLVTQLESRLDDLSKATHRVGNLRTEDSSQTVKLEQVTTSLMGIAQRVEARVTPPPPVVLPDWEGRWRWFGVGILVGIIVSIMYAIYV